jgi:azobenzene reductase
MAKKVIVLVGSGTRASRSLSLGRYIAERLTQAGAEVEIIDLLELQLPTFNATTEHDQTYDDKTRTFLEKSRAADGWVWVTPVYHNSYSSLLKTALDWQHWFFDGKVLGLVSHAGRNPIAMSQLLMIARAQHFVTIPTWISTQNSDYDESKNVISTDIRERIDNRFTPEFISYLDKFAS